MQGESEGKRVIFNMSTSFLLMIYKQSCLLVTGKAWRHLISIMSAMIERSDCLNKACQLPDSAEELEYPRLEFDELVRSL